MIRKKIVITSGGTGGHIIPAVVLGKKLEEEGMDVMFLGDEKLQSYITTNMNVSYNHIKSGQSLTQLKSIISIISGFFKSLRIIFKFKPDIVIGFGCYATLPVLMASTLLRKKIFLHEQNSHVGKVNKLFLPVAKYIFTSFYEIYGINIKYSSKIEFTGNPVRKEIVNLNTLEYKYPSEGEPFNILIIGGSGGASFFTKSFINIFKYFPLELKNKLNIIHQVKMEEEIEIAEQFYKKQSIRHEVKAFFNDIPERMKIANLVVSRAGTGAITELAVVGKAAIFVPSPNVSNNHQFYNAEFFRKNNACLLLEEKDFDEKKFSKVIINLINDEKELKNLSKNIKKLAQLDADKKICNFIIEELN